MVKQSILLFTLFLLLPTLSFAQSAASLSLRVEPALPEAGDAYTVTSYQSGGGAILSKQSWFLNGTEVVEAQNKTSVSLIASESPARITSRVTFTDGTSVEESMTISPLRVDLLLYAQTNTPEFYKGARLPSSGSTFYVGALVFKNNAQLGSGLSYLWSVDGKPQSAKPTLGKSSVSFASSFEKEVAVTVDIYNANNEKLASDSIVVPIVQPEVHFYENNALRGLTPVALANNHIFVGEEMTLRAEPYYMQNNFVPADNFVEWRINGRATEPTSADKQEIVLEKKGASGKATITFNVANLKNLLQGVKDSITLKF